MERLTAKDFAPELLELYDFYVHGKLSRREFLDMRGMKGRSSASTITCCKRHPMGKSFGIGLRKQLRQSVAAHPIPVYVWQSVWNVAEQ